MALSETLRSAFSRVWRYFEALAGAEDYDPVEEQRRWIAGLEQRIARIEAGLPAAPERSANPPTQT